MIHPILESAGAILGMTVTASLFALNIISLIRGKRVFRSPRTWRMR